MEQRSPALRPRPGKVVANLPYGIAAGVLLRTIERAAGVRRWVAMVQREVGERLAAAPGGRRIRHAFGHRPALLSRARCCAPCPAPSFTPSPTSTRCSSDLAGSRAPTANREAPVRRPRPRLRALVLVGAAFRHRRKTLAGSLALAQPSGGAPALTRQDVRAAVAAARPSRRCAGRAPLAGGLPGACTACSGYEPSPRARTRQGQPRAVPRADPAARRPARAGDASCSRSRSPTSSRSNRAPQRRRAPIRSSAPGVEVRTPRRTSRLRALLAFRRPPAGTRRPSNCRSTSASPSPPGSAGAPPTPPPRCGSPAHASGLGDRAAAARASPASSAPTSPPRSRPARWLATGAGELLRAAPPAPACASLCSCCPRRRALHRRGIRGGRPAGHRPQRHRPSTRSAAPSPRPGATARPSSRSVAVPRATSGSISSTTIFSSPPSCSVPASSTC